MAPKNRIIIDTDPGVDDVLAILLALSSSAEELEVLLLSVTFGNVDVRACTRNIIAIFHILDKELAWRKEQGIPLGFDGITKFKPLVAIGANGPLYDKVESADYFHGRDGLAGTTVTHPEFSPEEGWEKLFEKPPGDSMLTETAEAEAKVDISKPTSSFRPSYEPAHKEILRLLRENEPGTITIVAVGPLTNLALAAAEDLETFLRAKEVITMGGTVDEPGNVTPVAEFNVYADPVAAARVYALSSQVPSSTLLPAPTKTISGQTLAEYPATLSKPMKVTLMSLDVTTFHPLSRRQFNPVVQPLADRGSPLAQWMMSFMTLMFNKMERLHLGHEGDGAALELHDPFCIWYLLTQDQEGWGASEKSPEDIRVETAGKWTRGMTVGDKRLRRRRNSDGERPHDRDNWLGNRSGNRIWRILNSPGRDKIAGDLLKRVFGSSS